MCFLTHKTLRMFVLYDFIYIILNTNNTCFPKYFHEFALKFHAFPDIFQSLRGRSNKPALHLLHDAMFYASSRTLHLSKHHPFPVLTSRTRLRQK